jgi:hypothetical protein
MEEGIDWTQIHDAIRKLGRYGCVVEMAGASCNFIRASAHLMREQEQTPVGFEIDPDSCPITDNHEMSVEELFSSINFPYLLRYGKEEGNITKCLRVLDHWYGEQGLDINDQKIFLILDTCHIASIKGIFSTIRNLSPEKRKNLIILLNTSFTRKWNAYATAEKYIAYAFRKPRQCSTQEYIGRAKGKEKRLLSIWVEEDSSFFK